MGVATMRTPLIAGIDIGSSNIKVGVFRLDGSLIAAHEVVNELNYPFSNWSEYDPDRIWKSVTVCLRSALNSTPNTRDIAAVAVASMGEVGVPIDQTGRSLYTAISWMDQRATEQARWWCDNVGRERIFKLTGMPLDQMYSVNRLMWLREHRTDVYRATKKWLCIPDFISYKLTGEIMTDYSIASRTMAFDIRKKQWSEEICKAVDIDKSLFPECAQSGSVIGHVTADAAMTTGLQPGTPVVLGGHDHPCVAFALGISNPSQIVDSTGTGEGLGSVTDSPDLPIEIGETNRYSCYPHCVPDKYFILGHLGVVGGVIHWISELLQHDITDFEPSPELPLYFPHLNSTQSTVWESGIWVGLTPSCTGNDLVHSIMEGTCLWFRQSVELHIAGFKTRNCNIFLTGGLARYPVLTQMKTDVVDLPLEVPDFSDLALLGAALIAGVGAGVYRSWDDARSAVRISSKRYTQQPQRAAFFRERYRIYLNLSRSFETSIDLLNRPD